MPSEPLFHPFLFLQISSGLCCLPLDPSAPTGRLKSGPLSSPVGPQVLTTGTPSIFWGSAVPQAPIDQLYTPDLTFMLSLVSHWIPKCPCVLKEPMASGEAKTRLLISLSSCVGRCLLGSQQPSSGLLPDGVLPKQVAWEVFGSVHTGRRHMGFCGPQTVLTQVDTGRGVQAM